MVGDDIFPHREGIMPYFLLIWAYSDTVEPPSTASRMFTVKHPLGTCYVHKAWAALGIHRGIPAAESNRAGRSGPWLGWVGNTAILCMLNETRVWQAKKRTLREVGL